MSEQVNLGPQPGPQTKFLSTTADIALLGGAAGGGKSYALLLEPLRHYNNPRFGAVIFRRNTTQIRNEGGLWDESMALYGQVRGKPRESLLDWTFPVGSRVKFAHLEYAQTVMDWHGSQIPLLGFDELTSFLESQFWYMLSRNRSGSGVPGYMRATCNPDADSWVRRLVDWYIDNDTGFPIKERDGVIRWFARLDNELIWAATREELVKKYGPECEPKSFTFIRSTIYDNPILLRSDPSYLANLKALARVERMRLLEGNWNVRPASGLYFQKSWFEVIDSCGPGPTIRYWDRASTKPHEGNKDPDWSVGLKFRRTHGGIYVVMDIDRFQEGPLQVENRVYNNATADGRDVEVGIEQDPGQAGDADAQNYVRKLAGWPVFVNRVSKSKITRALPVSAQAENGNVKVLRGPWNDAFFREAENFPPEEGKGHDDQVDALSGGFNRLVDRPRDDFTPINIVGENRFA